MSICWLGARGTRPMARAATVRAVPAWRPRDVQTVQAPQLRQPCERGGATRKRIGGRGETESIVRPGERDEGISRVTRPHVSLALSTPVLQRGAGSALMPRIHQRPPTRGRREASALCYLRRLRNSFLRRKRGDRYHGGEC